MVNLKCLVPAMTMGMEILFVLQVYRVTVLPEVGGGQNAASLE